MGKDKDIPLHELYPPTLRTPLIDWAVRSGPADLPPPEPARAHLTGVLRTAALRGRRRGVVLGMAGWLVALLVVAVALAGALLVPVP